MVIEISDKVILDFYPILTFDLPKVQRLRQMRGLDILTPRQGYNDASKF